MRWFRQILLGVAAFCALAVMFMDRCALACPFCDAPTLLMSEQIQQCDHLVLGRWISGTKPTGTLAGSSQFEILLVAKSRDDRFQTGQVISLPFSVADAEGRHYALMGRDQQLSYWHVPIEVSNAAWEYLAQLPAPDPEPAGQAKNLEFAVQYFEHPEASVASDADAHFAAAPYETIVLMRDKLPRELLAGWLIDPKIPPTRLGLYGLLLGLCGTEEDAALMEQKIVRLESDFRLGIEGVMSGYLLIRGEPGLEVLEKTKMRADTPAVDANGQTIKLPFSETYAAMQALRFMWTYEPERIPRARLKASMRILLERPELSDLVIADLSRWKDWEIQDRLMQMYDEEKFNVPSIRRAIVRFLFFCSQEKLVADTATEPAAGSPASGPSSPTAEQPASPATEPPSRSTAALSPAAIQAAANLAALEQKDPRTVREAKRYLIR